MRQAKKEIIKLIQSSSGRWSPYQVFTDWIECMALSIQNACCLSHNAVWQKREQQYLGVVNKYAPDEHEAFSAMTWLLTQAMEESISDILGEIYMESGCGNKNTGQFFTPFNVSKACASMAIPATYDGSEILTINEPSCGAGGMILAMASILHDRGINYQRCMRVVAQDLDWKGVYMTYVQLSLYGIDAIVVQGDTLAEPYAPGYPPERCFRTPRNMGALI